MKIATLQYAPKLGDVQGNIQRVDALLSKGGGCRRDGDASRSGSGSGSGIEGLKPDILVLSEMALTGYNFPSLKAIKPYLEPAGQGLCGTWARETARRLGCKVCVGYPEVEIDHETEEKYYNSLLVVDENGEVLVNYRKTFLYYTDETWAAEGDAGRGFKQLSLPKLNLLDDDGDGQGQGQLATVEKGLATSFGICMDINPYRFEAPFSAWEFANRVLDSRSQLVILSMAWLTHLDREQLDALGKKPDSGTFNYWIVRFMPLFRRRMQHDDGGGNLEGEKRVVVVFSNRVGEEEGHGDDNSPVRYAGTSAILAFSQKPSSSSSTGDSDSDEDGIDVKILCWDLMGATEEGICYADTTADPNMVFDLVKAGE